MGETRNAYQLSFENFMAGDCSRCSDESAVVYNV